MWQEELSPALTDLSWVIGEKAEHVQPLVRGIFTPFFETRIGGSLLLAKTIDTTTQVTMFLYGVGAAHYLAVRRKTPYAERKNLSLLLYMMAGKGPQYLVFPTLIIAFADALASLKRELGPPPLDLQRQRYLLGRVNGLAEGGLAAYYDITMKGTSILAMFVFPLFFHSSAGGVWRRCSCGIAFSMNLAYTTKLVTMGT